MRYRVTLFCTLFLVASALAQGYRPKEGYVPDSATALRVGEAVLVPVYGVKHIESEKPFTATLKHDVWTIQGTLHCSDGLALCDRGVAEVRISKADGRILFMNHGK
jgi:hypothetical protein